MRRRLVLVGLLAAAAAAAALASRGARAAGAQPGLEEPAWWRWGNELEPAPEISPAPPASPWQPWEDWTRGEGAVMWDEPPGVDVSSDPARNVEAMVDLIVQVEANGRYDVIAGYPAHPEAIFSDFREHPYVLEPERRRYIGTSASGGPQMVKGTWIMARDALGLTDFSPESQRAAARWILQYKRPRAWPHVLAGRFRAALYELRSEWEAFDKILAGRYPVTLAQAESIYAGAGGAIA